MPLLNLLKKTRITVNGRQYGSVEEMPPDARRQYEKIMSMMTDTDGNGVPDLFDGTAAGGKGINVVTVSNSSVQMNGRPLGGMDELPAEVRRRIEQAQQTTPSRPLRPSPANGLTIPLNGTMLAALVAAVMVTSLIVWLIR